MNFTFEVCVCRKRLGTQLYHDKDNNDNNDNNDNDDIDNQINASTEVRCIHTGEMFSNVYFEEQASIFMNKNLKIHGYNDYVPHTKTQFQTYWKTRFNVDVDVDDENAVLPVDSTIGKMVVPRRFSYTMFVNFIMSVYVYIYVHVFNVILLHTYQSLKLLYLFDII